MIWEIIFALYAATVITAMAVMFGLVVGWRWWQPPVKLRFKFPAYDKFCCLTGLHRCVPTCRKGCCWECVRCEAEKAGKLNEHYANIAKALEAQ